MALGLDPISDWAPAPLERYQASLGEYLGAVADEQWQNNPLPSLLRWFGRLTDNYGTLGAFARLNDYATPGGGDLTRRALRDLGAAPEAFQPKTPWLSADEVQRRGKELGLNLTTPMSEAAFDSIAAERRRHAANDLVFQRAREGGAYGVGRAALSVLTEFAVNLADPLNLASAFLPVTRAPLLAARLGAIESAGLRRLATGAIEGAVGNLAVEPFVALAALQEDPQYGPANWLMTAAFGAALGGGLHWLGGRFAPDIRTDAGARATVAAGTPPESAARGAGEVLPAGNAVDAARTAEALQRGADATGGLISSPPDFGPRRINEDLAGRVPQETARAIEAAYPETRDAAQYLVTAQVLRDRRPDAAWLYDADPRFVAAKAAYEQQTRFAREIRVSVDELRARQRFQDQEIARLRATKLDFRPPADFAPSKAALDEAKAVQAGALPGRKVKEPESLAQFVRRTGGIDVNDPLAGDLRGQDLGGLSGLLRRRGEGGVRKDMTRARHGHSSDAMGEAAQQAGFYTERPTREQLVADLIDDAHGTRKTYADTEQLAQWRDHQETQRAFDDYVRSLEIDPKAYDERTLAYILSLDPARQRVIDLERAFGEGKLSEDEALAVAARLDRELAAGDAAAMAEARDAAREAFDPSLEGNPAPDYRGLTQEEFDALDRDLGRLEEAADGADPYPRGPESAGDGQGAAAPFPQGEFDAPAPAPDFSQARFATEARISPDTLEAFARRQDAPASDLHADFDAAANAAAYVELRSTDDIAAALADAEAAVRPLLTDADKEALAAADAAFKDDKAMIDAFAACGLGGGRG